MPNQRIIVGERFRKDLGNLEALAQSIKKIGLLHPIVVTESGLLVAGHRRLEAWKLLGRNEEDIPRNVIPHHIPDAEIEENTVRKDFTFTEKAAIWKHYHQQKSNEARQRQGTRTDLQHSSNLDECYGRTDDKIAEIVGTGKDTLRKIVAIVEAAEVDPKLYGSILKEAENDTVSINKAYKKVQIKQKQQEIKASGSPPLPDGVYDVFYADPPWQYDYYGSLRGKADIHYPTLGTKEICLLPIGEHVANDAIIFLWVTNPFLKDGLLVLNEWGFEYKTCMVWVKPKFGTGFYARSQHELLLIGRKGKMPHPADEDRPPSVIQAPSKRHSEKPSVVYDLIEKMYPKRRYLELYARNERAGWDSWGNEVE